MPRTRNQGTGQYLWLYGTGKFAAGPLVIFFLQLDGATGYFEGCLYGATGPRYCGTGSWIILRFSGLFHIENTGPEQIYTTGLTFILEGDFNGAIYYFL